MTKKIMLAMSLLLMTATAAMAIPAKRGIWKTLRLNDGTEVRASLAGDEHLHFYVTEDGQRYVADGDHFVAVSEETLAQRQAQGKRSAQHRQANRLRSPKKTEIGQRTNYVGQKKGLVILAQFTDQSFQAANNLARYKAIFNQENYNEGSFRGSVADYFKDQSNGLFELDFDVVGPVSLAHNVSYYGGNNYNDEDMRPEEMIVEACQAVDAQVDFNDYDWDGDGEVDQVFVVYAGKGEADGGAANTIWPHMWMLDEAGQSLTLDGVKINTYACSNELDTYNSLEGIGTFCHEFSHCLGFPDFYDTSYSGWYGMGDYDLMCSGSYNGDGFCPPNYTAHEKMMCGWKEPIELDTYNVTVENLQSASNHGDTYIIYNKAHPDEYYMVENRQKTGWDTYYPDKGLMITHVDFDEAIWAYNIPNTKNTGSPRNDHQRMTIVAADGTPGGGGYYGTGARNDLFPYGSRDSLSNTSNPSASLYNANTDGSKLLNRAILNIRQNSDGTVSFNFRGTANKEEDTPEEPDDPIVEPVEGQLFYESFNQCSGTGGNDDQWSGTSVGSALFVADNEGWESAQGKQYGAKECAKFGVSSVPGTATSPAITLTGAAVVTFKASAWNNRSDGTTLQLSVVTDDNIVVEPAEVIMPKEEWGEFTAHVTGTGTFRLVFAADKRFFLDEVLVVEDKQTTGIEGLSRRQRQTALPIFTLDGRLVGTDRTTLRPGIYVSNGKKFVK